MTPSSIALLGQSFPEPREQARAVGVWAMGGAVASSSGPVVGGLLATLNWRLIFINVPVGLVAHGLLFRTQRSPRRPAPFDVVGQFTAVLAMGGLTYGAIEGGAKGFADPAVIAASVVAGVAAALFVRAQARGAHPMVPLGLFASRTFRAVVGVGFAFVVCYYGLPFVVSLYLQQVRGVSALLTGIAFLPMMLFSTAFTPASARIVERFGRTPVIVAGLLLMVIGLVPIAALPTGAPVWVVAALMVFVGLGGPAVMPPATAALLGAVPASAAGTASGVFNTSRQLGGALAVAVFGALLTHPDSLLTGLRISLLIAAVVAAAAAALTWRLGTATDGSAAA